MIPPMIPEARVTHEKMRYGGDPGVVGEDPGVAPGVVGEVPGVVGEDPGVVPGVAGEVPGVVGEDPGVVPGVVGEVPGVVPGVVGEVPGVVEGVPGVVGEVPGVVGAGAARREIRLAASSWCRSKLRLRLSLSASLSGNLWKSCSPWDGAVPTKASMILAKAVWFSGSCRKA